MLLKVAYNDKSEDLVKELKELLMKFPLVELEAYHEEIFKERKKAFALKSEWGTRQSPFAILIDDHTPVTVFYNEQGSCTIDKITETLQNWIVL